MGEEPRSKERAQSSTSLELVLSELVADAEHLLDLPYMAEWHDPNSRTAEERVEVIEEAVSVTVLIQAPGYTDSEIRVNPGGSEIVVRTPDFELKSRLPAPVVADSLRRSYRNGVLSLVLSKAL